MDPLEHAVAQLGEHFDHYLIVVSTEPHECLVEYDNSFAALGLLNTAAKIIDKQLDTGSLSVRLEEEEEDDEDEEDDAYEDEEDEEDEDDEVT
tara:strand:- start:132 stop:410 length:279 start_codon:yes stop_codon:yes gene_type:complete